MREMAGFRKEKKNSGLPEWNSILPHRRLFPSQSLKKKKTHLFTREVTNGKEGFLNDHNMVQIVVSRQETLLHRRNKEVERGSDMIDQDLSDNLIQSIA